MFKGTPLIERKRERERERERELERERTRLKRNTWAARISFRTLPSPVQPKAQILGQCVNLCIHVTVCVCVCVCVCEREREREREE